MCSFIANLLEGMRRPRYKTLHMYLITALAKLYIEFVGKKERRVLSFET